MPRGNKENLKTPSTEEARVRGRKGGKASGKARREKKDMRETFLEILDMPMKAGKLSDAEDFGASTRWRCARCRVRPRYFRTEACTTDGSIS